MKFTRRTLAAAHGSVPGRGAAGLGAIAHVLSAPQAASATRDKMSVNKLLQCVTLQGVMEHEWALQRIANAHDGTRASATPGYDASAAYVIKRMRKAGYKVSTQSFPYFNFEEEGPSELEQTAPDAVTYTEGTDFARDAAVRAGRRDRAGDCRSTSSSVWATRRPAAASRRTSTASPPATSR